MTKELEAIIQRKDAHLSALTQMSVAMNSKRSTAELMDLVSKQTRDLVGADRVSIMLVDPLSEQLSIVSSTGVDEDVIQTMHLKKGEGIAGKVWAEGKPLLIPDTSKSPDYLKISQKRQPLAASLISVPINDSIDTFGVINVQRPLESGIFEEEELNLLTLIGIQTAGTLLNVRLVSDLQDQIRSIRSAQEIGNVIVSTFDVDTVLRLIVRGIRDVTGADACSIMLLDEEGEYLFIRASEGIPEDIAKTVRIRKGENIAGWVAQEGRPLLISNIEEDDRFECTAKGRYSTNSVLSVPLKAKGRLLGVINVNRLVSTRPFNSNDENLLMIFSNQAAIALENARLYNELQRLAITDGLTGLANHRAFQDQLKVELARASRFFQEVSLLIIDIDHFKSINDSFGHQRGDHVLRCVGQALQRLVRKMDMVARYGGEEFAIIMPQTDKSEAIRIADRIRKSVEKERWVEEDPTRSITLSMGVSEYPKDAHDPAILVELADLALYQSKQNGRNRVTSATPDMLKIKLEKPT
ncbi:MAG: sensor domain-containing diguanylate cyclase [Candidatus Omnitrophica bacterium]|nr:sensor domain-containing diguanylate cyclase [Candidatus Omnitrophota bacterium]MCB9767263.1 sensor domain-containing diguanylate cyclase [Candidatus Omnitrophota bacterium]MCB9784413.1 sensor domain-containing diguanylate cyclase [Candidatus Omnitrophota bacterium]